MGGSRKGSYQATPYTGPSPWAPSHSQLQKQYDVMEPTFRSRMLSSEGFGKPWMEAGQGLVERSLSRKYEDLKKQALGRMQAQNIRGTIVGEQLRPLEQQYGENLQDALAKLTIANREQQLREMGAYSDRYANLLNLGAGQSQAAAQHAANIWSTGEANRYREATQPRQPGIWGPLAQFGMTAAGALAGGPAGAATGNQVGSIVNKSTEGLSGGLAYERDLALQGAGGYKRLLPYYNKKLITQPTSLMYGGY